MTTRAAQNRISINQVRRLFLLLSRRQSAFGHDCSCCKLHGKTHPDSWRTRRVNTPFFNMFNNKHASVGTVLKCVFIRRNVLIIICFEASKLHIHEKRERERQRERETERETIVRISASALQTNGVSWRCKVILSKGQGKLHSRCNCSLSGLKK